MNLNKAFLIGNLTRDPELKTLPSGTSVASFGVATNRVWKNQQGERQEEVQFHNVVVFGKQAETTSQYLTKGSLVFVEGRIQTRSWEGQGGQKNYRTEIVAERIQFGPRGAGGSGGFGKGDASTGQGGGFVNKANFKPVSQPEAIPEIDINEEVRPEDLPF